MKILVINAGSSSLKYQLIDMEQEFVLAKGNCDRIAIEGGSITHKLSDGRVYTENCAFADHADAFRKLVEVLTTGEYAVVKDLSEITAIGHRAVQGAEYFSESVLATDEVVKKIEEFSPLAPLHNPSNVLAIRACKEVFGADVPEVVVFDTAFHQTIPQKAYMYGLPYEYYEKYHIRKYGFHGTSHRFVSAKLAEVMGRDLKDLKVITCHLGNGSSIAAVDHGKCVDTTMGFTPLDGLMMGTRCGSIDPSAVTYVMEKEGLTPAQMNTLMNKQSGYLGISGFTSDDRDIRQATAEGNERAKLAGDMLAYQVKKVIGSYVAAMNGLDALVFTGGIGENSVPMRRTACEDMDVLGIKLDLEKNEALNRKEGLISTPDSKVKVYIIPTNEELLIARDTKAIVEKL